VADRKNTKRRMQTHQRIGAAVLAGGLGVIGISIPAGAQTVEGPILCAFVFDDADGDGIWQPDEEPLSFVQVELGSGVEPFGYIESGVTNADGLVCFAVEPGVAYKLKEFNPPGYLSTTPDSVYPIVVGETEDVVIDFGDWIPVEPTVPEPTVPDTTTATTAASTTVATTATTAASTTVATTATTAASTTVATTAPTTAPSTVVITTTSLLTTPTVLPSSAVPSTTRTALTGTLPATGGESDLALVGAGMVVLGGLMSAVRRKPAG
jgi:LPXTG-motif cell wall-anchored protein